MDNLIYSLNKNKKGIAIMTLAALMTAFGQLQWKLSGGDINLHLIAGFVLYFLGAVLMIVAYRYGSLSVLHPILSLGYIFALLLGTLFLQEVITEKNILGTLLIILGATLIGGGDN